MIFYSVEFLKISSRFGTAPISRRSSAAPRVVSTSRALPLLATCPLLSYTCRLWLPKVKSKQSVRQSQKI